MKKLSLCLITIVILTGISVISLPEAQGQTVYDNYAWYGYYTQGDWTLTTTDTQFNNMSAYVIGQTGYVVEYSTYSGDTKGTMKFKLARATGNKNEWDIYHVGSSHNVIIGLQNYTLATHVAVNQNDVFGFYGSSDPQMYKTFGGGQSTIYVNGDLSGTQTLPSLQANLRMCMQVLVGWDDPPSDWGTYIWHGFMIAGVVMMTYAPIHVVKEIKAEGELDEKTVGLLMGFIVFMIGLGLFYTWITYT